MAPGGGAGSKKGLRMDKELMTVSIPASLYRKIEETIKGTGVASVDDYVTKVLREKLTQAGPDDAFTKEDEDKVKERLKALGYID
jgi:Arc/MetJ-type ribon-helix-helix transcriptional regulator